MPVFIEDTDIGDLLKLNICQVISEKFARLKEEAIKFRSQPVQTCHSNGVLYVNQREFACSLPDDDAISVIGTEDATTCHILVLRNKVLIFFYFFTDEFHNQPLPISLMTACMSDFNDVVKNGIHWPVIYGIGVDLKNGTIFPATFSDKGPDMTLRSTKTFVGDKDMMNIYDYKSRELRIKSFHYNPWPRAFLWLQQSDTVIKQNLSTSPDVEPPDFVSHVRETLKYVILHPQPGPDVFPGGQPRRYRKDGHGMWVRIE
ncbi:protein N-terminal asparagine amidohydrolase-like [Anneissia japonica]|uniref:protein N-terminal asparagine amidohydrolase-like n=1 Tax=Anneissia japonica TaxID=1529436 RepID=UPI0014255168|nr:protein N-terminal asparagine amidohydrolase-like [Anneissia japonica]